MLMPLATNVLVGLLTWSPLLGIGLAPLWGWLWGVWGMMLLSIPTVIVKAAPLPHPSGWLGAS